MEMSRTAETMLRSRQILLQTWSNRLGNSNFVQSYVQSNIDRLKQEIAEIELAVSLPNEVSKQAISVMSYRNMAKAYCVVEQPHFRYTRNK